MPVKFTGIADIEDLCVHKVALRVQQLHMILAPQEPNQNEELTAARPGLPRSVSDVRPELAKAQKRIAAAVDAYIRRPENDDDGGMYDLKQNSGEELARENREDVLAVKELLALKKEMMPRGGGRLEEDNEVVERAVRNAVLSMEDDHPLRQLLLQRARCRDEVKAEQ